MAHPTERRYLARQALLLAHSILHSDGPLLPEEKIAVEKIRETLKVLPYISALEETPDDAA